MSTLLGSLISFVLAFPLVLLLDLMGRRAALLISLAGCTVFLLVLTLGVYYDSNVAAVAGLLLFGVFFSIGKCR